MQAKAFSIIKNTALNNPKGVSKFSILEFHSFSSASTVKTGVDLVSVPTPLPCNLLKTESQTFFKGLN